MMKSTFQVIKVKLDNHPDEPIYGWKLNDDGSVTRITPITAYEHRPNNKIRFEDGSYYKWLSPQDFDRFVHNRYYSFENNEEKAIAAMKKAIAIKYKVANKQLAKIKKLRDNFNRNLINTPNRVTTQR